MKNSLKDKLRYEYENETEVPSSDLWDKLEAKLDAAKSNEISNPSNSINLLKYAAVVLCLIALGILFKFTLNDDSAKNNIPTLTKIKAPAKIEIQNSDSINKFKKIEIQTTENLQLSQTENQEFVQTQKLELKSQSNEKFITNSPKVIKGKKEENPTPEYFIETKKIETPIVQKEEKQIIANNTVNVPIKKSNTEYVKADELRFGRELQKERIQVANNKNKLQDFTNALVQKITPSSVTIFGLMVYSEEETPK